MSTNATQNTVPKLRTYAADLNSVRTKTPTSAVVSTAVKNQQPNIIATAVPTIADTGIPPFHSFSNPHKERAPDTATKLASEPHSQIETQKILTQNSDISAQSAGKENLPAIIITDTKHKRFKLSEAIVDSITDWWTAKKAVAKQKKIPRYTVQQAERRKGVIQKATTKTGRTVAADHSSVISRIKATKQIPHTTTPEIFTQAIPSPTTATWETADREVATSAHTTTPLSLKINPQSTEQDVIQKTSPTQHDAWESAIQTQVNSLTEPKPESKLILTGKEFSKIKQARALETLETKTVVKEPVRIITPMIPTIPTAPQKEVAKVITPIKPRLPETFVVRPDIPQPVAAVEMPVEQTAAPIIPTPITRPKIIPTIPTALHTPIVAPTLEPAISTPRPITPIPPEPVNPPQTERRFAPPREKKRSIFNVLTQTNHIVFFLLAYLFFVVVSGLGVRAYLGTSSTPVTQPELITDTSVFIDTTITSDTNFVATAADLTNAIKAQLSSADSLIEITFLNQQGTILLPGELLNILDTEVLFDFKSALTDVALGTYRGTPWMVFRFSDKNTALGGMLDWESTMYRDLNPILGNETGLSRNRFTDSIIGTSDVRVLKNTKGEEEIVYGFTDFNTLLITTNSTAFLNLAGKFK